MKSLEDVKIEISESMTEQLKLIDVIVGHLEKAIYAAFLLVLFAFKPMSLWIVLPSIMTFNVAFGIYYSARSIKNGKKLGNLLSSRDELLQSHKGQE